MSSPSGPPSAKRRRLDFSEEVTLLVGAEEKRFNFHKNVLAKHSKFFRAAFSNGFKETQEKLIRLPDIHPDLLAAYVQWSYSGQVILTDTEAEEKVKEGTDFRHQLVRFYIVADVLDDTLLRNAILDKLVESQCVCNKGCCPDTIRLIYENTIQKSKPRRFILDSHVSQNRDCVLQLDKSAAKHYPKWMEKWQSELPADFVLELLQAVARDEGSVLDSAKLLRCRYHEHDEDVPACTG